MTSNNDSTATDIPTFLRFLTQEGKLPLSKAMLSLKNLQQASLSSPSAISKSNLETLTPLVTSADDAKRLLNAAKRVTKRASTSSDVGPSRGKKRKLSPTNEDPTPKDLEDSLALPEPVIDLDTLRPVVLYTNRAPLLLAFAVVLLEFTMPSQPLSSRLSLAQAMVSAGAREKAVNLGIESGKSAEEEGFGMGQPVVRVMGKEVRVLKRWDYEWKPTSQETETQSTIGVSGSQGDIAEQEVKEENNSKDKANEAEPQEPALWGLDLEALKKSNSSSATSTNGAARHGTGLPIYTPQSARSYLIKSFASVQSDGSASSKSGKAAVEAKERNLGLLLGALKVVYQSWSELLETAELNRRAWSWYVSVRPDVESGVAGWGGKGQVSLAKLISLRKQ